MSLPRSLDLVVALYAVHKAGGAYLPVDRDYPAELCLQYLADEEPPIIVASALDLSNRRPVSG